MAIEFKRIAGAVRQDGKLIPLQEGEKAPPPEAPPAAPSVE